MRNSLGKVSLLLVGLAVWCLCMPGCSDSREEERNRQIVQQVDMIEEQLAAVEKHQQGMREMVEKMQQDLMTMQEELNKESPRIHAANIALGSIRSLTINGLGDTPLEATAKDPAWSMWNVLWLLLFVFILWLLYRMRARSAQ